MSSPRTEPHPNGRAAAPRELGAAIQFALVVVAALLVVFALDYAGLVGAINDGLDARWARLGAAAGNERRTNAVVLLVAADEETIDGPIDPWGPPPWPAARLEQLLEQIEGTGAVLVAEAGHTRLFAPGPELDRLIDARGVLFARSDERGASPWSGLGLEHGDIVLGSDSRMHWLARAANLPAIGERLPVHWLVPKSRLPMVSLHEAASDDNLRGAFRSRIVLVGMTDPRYEMRLDTPVGRLTPAEIEAHALTGVTDGVVWADVPVAVIYIALAGFAAVFLWVVRRSGSGKTIAFAVASTTLVLVVDFACYHRGIVRLGAGYGLLTILAVGSSHWLNEARETFVGLRALRARVLREAAGKGTSADDEQGFWSDLAELGAEYARETLAGAAACSVIERGNGSWTLTVRASADLDEDSHAALSKREGLDIRRAPFRTPWLTLRAGWAVDVLPRSARYGRRKSLIVPLEDESELLGLWLIHVADDHDVSVQDIETFERLGRQMAVALVRRRERIALREQGTHTRLRDYMDTIVGGLRMLRDEQRWALELLEQLPVRALIATVWGEIEFVDPRLKDDLIHRYPGLFSPDQPADNLRVVLARLTGQSMDEANRLLRKVVHEGVEIELDAKPGLEDPGDDVWVLSRIRSKRGIELPGFKPAVHEHILLVARSSAPAQTIRTRSGKLLRVLGGGSGKT
jgi:CHASE2 domain-containing sensor protein/GAF domain-containing protein